MSRAPHSRTSWPDRASLYRCQARTGQVGRVGVGAVVPALAALEVQVAARAKPLKRLVVARSAAGGTPIFSARRSIVHA